MRGGYWPGSGRKPGAKTKKNVLLAEKAKALGITPLDVMLEHMKACYVKGDLAGAHNAAKDAAPYLHARLSSIDARLDQQHHHHVVDDAWERLTYELDRLAAERGARRGAEEAFTGTTH